MFDRLGSLCGGTVLAMDTQLGLHTFEMHANQQYLRYLSAFLARMLDAQSVSSDIVFPNGMGIVALMRVRNEVDPAILRFVEDKKAMDGMQFTNKLSDMIRISLGDDAKAKGKVLQSTRGQRPLHVKRDINQRTQDTSSKRAKLDLSVFDAKGTPIPPGRRACYKCHLFHEGPHATCTAARYTGPRITRDGPPAQRRSAHHVESEGHGLRDIRDNRVAGDRIHQIESVQHQMPGTLSKYTFFPSKEWLATRPPGWCVAALQEWYRTKVPGATPFRITDQHCTAVRIAQNIKVPNAQEYADRGHFPVFLELRLDWTLSQIHSTMVSASPDSMLSQASFSHIPIVRVVVPLQGVTTLLQRGNVMIHELLGRLLEERMPSMPKMVRPSSGKATIQLIAKVVVEMGDDAGFFITDMVDLVLAALEHRKLAVTIPKGKTLGKFVSKDYQF